MPSHNCDHSVSAVKLVPVSSAGVALVVCGGTFLARWKRSIANRASILMGLPPAVEGLEAVPTLPSLSKTGAETLLVLLFFLLKN